MVQYMLLFVKKEGVIALTSQVPFAEGLRSARLVVVAGTVDIITMPYGRERCVGGRKGGQYLIGAWNLMQPLLRPLGQLGDGEAVRERVAEGCRLACWNPHHFLSRVSETSYRSLVS
jgi:hypothetical protein